MLSDFYKNQTDDSFVSANSTKRLYMTFLKNFEKFGILEIGL